MFSFSFHVRYDRDFLMQFMHICKEKPATLSPRDVLGIEPVDLSSFAMTRGGSGHHRNPSSAAPSSATRQASLGLGIGGFQKPSALGPFLMDNFQSARSKLASEEGFALSPGSRSTSVVIPPSQYRSTMVRTPSQGGPGHPKASNRSRSKRGVKRGDSSNVSMSQQGQGSAFGSSSIEPVAPLELSANRWVPTSAVRKVQPDVSRNAVAAPMTIAAVHEAVS